MFATGAATALPSFWGPVISGVQTANLTLALVLAAALAWRWRDRVALSGVATGLAVAAKVVSAPTVIWYFATRRWRAGLITVTFSVAVTAVLLGVIHFATDGVGALAGKPVSVATYAGTPSYSPIDILSEQGLSRWVGAAVALILVAALSGLSVRFGVSGDDRRSFAAAAIAIIVVAPNIWLHSLTFLLLPLGVLRPRFGWLWLVPAVLLVVRVAEPSTWEWITLWAVGGFVAAWAMMRPTAVQSREHYSSP